jgi:hypothetical protein
MSIAHWPAYIGVGRSKPDGRKSRRSSVFGDLALEPAISQLISNSSLSVLY